MLLFKADDPFDDSDYITELKLDGICLIYWWTWPGRYGHNNEVTAEFPVLVALGSTLPPGTTQYGEIIVSETRKSKKLKTDGLWQSYSETKYFIKPRPMSYVGFFYVAL
ncbi:hypothetical protein [Peribacillus glennii]|uniref:Uncharacterized protein n=1 Tax=Peribacillus glennii TaxID=2303991 RepID=A0A372L7Q4_9BACI|nr:hypothetical protein [Peribacillus glennii]RFU61293.1 hypothetical protein D0466_18970 [Peribacillus glennii]